MVYPPPAGDNDRPMAPWKLSNRATWAAVIGVLAVYAVLAWCETSRVGITVDERSYFHAGHIVLDSGWSHTVTRYHGPLPFLANQLFAPPLPSGGLAAVADQMEYIRRGRLGMLPFGLLAAILVFLWSRSVFGNRGGLFSLGLFAFHPLMIGYGGLLAVDMAHVAGTLLCLFLLWRFLQRPSAARCAHVGLGLGVALATKYLAVLLGPPVVVIAAVRTWRARGPAGAGGVRRGFAAGLGAVLAISILAVITLHACYGFRVGGAPVHADAYGGEFLRTVTEVPVLGRLVGVLPEPYVRGVDYHLTRAEHLPFQPFLDGRYAPRHPTFYVWAFLYKTPEWMIALAAWLVLAKIPGWLRGRGSFAERSAAWVVLPVAVVMVGFLSFLTRQQLGVRYILPDLALLLVLLGFVPGTKLLRGLSGRAWLALLLPFALYHGQELWTAWPSLISYYNRSAGGEAAAYRHFNDSDSNWGQFTDTIDERLRGEEGGPFTLLTAAAGPRFGRVAIALRSLTRADPEDPTRARHWLYACAPVGHVAGSYWMYDVTPEGLERAVERSSDERIRADLVVACLGTEHRDEARRHAALLSADRGDPLLALLDLLDRLREGTLDGPATLALLGGLVDVGRFDLVERTVREHPELAVVEAPWYPTLRARSLAGQGRTKEAITLLEQRGNLDLPRTAFQLAGLYAEEQRFGDAVALLERLREVAPGVDAALMGTMLESLRGDQRELESFLDLLR